MKRKIITICEELCTGCGLCAAACHEGAIGMVNGKAKLLRENYCDGLGDCLPACPVGAISFEEREAPAYDHNAVLAAKSAQKKSLPCGCPSTQSKVMERRLPSEKKSSHPIKLTPVQSELCQWPVQLKLAPVNAPYFSGAQLLVAADCTAFSYGDFHRRFIKDHVTLIGCPKLDEGDYTEKLTEILCRNEIRSVTVVRMEVPCCKGLENAVKNALQASGKIIPWHTAVISTEGIIIQE